MGSLSDLRKLNQDIERKKKEAEQANLKAVLAERELLSDKMKAGIKERQEKAGKMASDSKTLKHIIILISVVFFVIIIAVILKSAMGFNSRPAQTAILLDNDLKKLDARNDEFIEVSKFVKSLLAKISSGDNPESLTWSDKITNSAKERSLEKIQELASGEWEIASVGYNEKFGFFNIQCTQKGQSGILTLRITEDKKYNLKLVKVY